MHKHGKSPNADKSRFRLHQKSAWKAVTIALSICVALGTTAALVLPAITLSEATCEIPEHTHSQEAGCYSAGTETEIVCDYETLGVHQHTSDCYDGDGNPVCGYADVILHEHDSLCYDESGALICTLPVVAEHEHDGNCYTETQTLVQEGHTHTDECYAWNVSETLVCGLEETDEHQHDDTCYTGSRELTCTREEQEAVYESGEPQLTCTEKAIRYHVHTEDCYTYDEVLGENVLTCTETVILHEHDSLCYDESGALICTLPVVAEHQHDGNCYTETQTLVQEGHAHTDECYVWIVSETLVCGLEETDEHQHDDTCYTGSRELTCTREEQEAVYESGEPQLTCTEKTIRYHVHTEDCFTYDEALEENVLTCTETVVDRHQHTEACFKEVEETILTCELSEHTHSDDCMTDPAGEDSDDGTGIPELWDTADHALQTEPEDISTQATLSPEINGAQLKVTYLPSGNEDSIAAVQTVSSHVGGDLAESYVMEIHPVDAEGTEIPADDSVQYTVTLQFPSGILAGDGQIQLLHIRADDTVESLPVILTRNGKLLTQISFTTDSFSQFVLVRHAISGTLLDGGELLNQEGTSTLYWSLTESDSGAKTLTVSGEGSLPYFKASGDAPWHTYYQARVKIVFAEGITHTGRESFRSFQVSGVVFPSTLKTIGTQSLSYLSGLTKMEVPGTVTELEPSAFIYCGGITEFILHEGTEILGDSSLGSQADGGAPLYIPASVTSIGNHLCWTATEYIVDEDNPNYQSIDGVLFTKDGQTLVDYPDRRVAESYTVPAGITVQADALKRESGSTRQFIISEDVHLLGSQHFRDGHFVSLIIKDGVYSNANNYTIPDTGWEFVGDRYLTELVLPSDTILSTGSSMLGGCYNLTSLTIPKSVTKIWRNSILNGDQHSLTDIRYNAQKAEFIESNIADGKTVTPFNLTIGVDVDYLHASFAELVNLASNLSFEGPNTFYVEDGAFANAPAPLTGLSGWISIPDTVGSIYLLDPETETATFFASSPTTADPLQIVDSITVETMSDEAVSGKTFTVTAVDDNALTRSPFLTALQFQDAAQITSIGAYAFANTNIERIVDLATGTEATTVDEADALFAEECNLGYGRYDNTKLDGAEGFGPGFAENMGGVPSLHASVENPESPGASLANLKIEVHVGSTTKWVPSAENSERGGYESLTGDLLEFQINNDYSARENNAEVVYRFYVKRTNANCVLSYSVGTYTLNVEGGSITVVCKATEDPNTFEIDVTGTPGVTATLPISVQYPSPKSYGGGVQVSAEIVVTTSEGTIFYPATYDTSGTEGTRKSKQTTGEYIQASWKTERLDYGLYHQNVNAGNSNEQKTVSIYSDATGTRFFESLQYTYSLNNSTGRSDNLGCDYVTYVDFTQVLELPEGVTWDEDVLRAIRREDGEFLTVTRGDVYYNNDKIITIKEPSSPLFLLNIGVEADDNGKVTLSWRIKNSGTGEMGNISYALTIYQHALSVKVSEAPGDGGVNIDSNAQILSTVTAEIHFTHTDPETKSDIAIKTIRGGDAEIKLTKESTQVSYFGEDITYTIHGVNIGGVPYVFEDAGKAYLWDELSVDTYIKPENMERMFQEAEAGGRHLTIRIDKAQITAVNTAGWAVPVDGVATANSRSISQSVLLNSGNSDYPTTEASLLIHYDGNGFYRVEQIQQTAAGSTGIIPTEEPIWTETGQDLDELLHRFGYGPTVQALYTCVWQLRDTGKDLVFQPGESHEVYIYATVKNTYQLSNQDWPNHYPVDSQKSISNKAAFLSVVNAENKFTDLARSNQVSNAVRREAVLTMRLSYQDESGNTVYCTDAMPSGLTNKQILDYDLYFTHYGKGSYDDMPMVDELTGNQYLLVPVDANTALASKNLDTVTDDRDGKEYYRLSEGTYNNVYVGEDKGQLLIADTITVTSNEGTAATTKIKWYYEHIDGGEYEFDVKFKTVLWMDEHDASYTLGNETWMNDRTNDRIYAALWGGGILLTYNKEIVVEKSQTDLGNDVIFESYIGTDPNPYPVSQGETVLYRLTLDSTGKGAGTYHGSLFADALPDTFGKFEWTKDNVEIVDVEVAGQVEGADELLTKWSIQREYRGIKGEGVYFIRWDDGDDEEQDKDDVYLHFNDDSLVYIYVELTFPKNTEENQLWHDYALAANGATLTNAFFLDLYNASVTHVLRTPGEVRLQKGVYALARGSEWQSTNEDIILTGTSRYYYNNTDNRVRRVIYYIALYNDGGSRLYLNDIQDQLPAGFTFEGLMNPAEMDKTNHASVMSIVCADSTSSFTQNTLGIDYKSFRVKAEAGAVGENGKQNVVFKIDSVGSKNSLAYDELRQQYYLDNGQAICFAYVVNIAANGTADEALNTAAMAYTDHVSAGVIACDGGRITANSLNYIDQNDGDCVILTRSEVEQKEYNFTLDGADSQTGDYWLVSDVSLTRGSIRPGIRKNTVSYRAPGNNTSMPYNSSVGYQDIVDWQIRLDNGGDSTIVDYTVRDKMDPPYVFTGPVSYNIFDMNGSLTAADNLLFTVEGFEVTPNAKLSEGILQVTAPDTLSQWITHINVRDAYNNVKSVEIGGEPMELTGKFGNNSSAKMDLSFHWEDASLVMDIRFKDVYFAIPEHGYMTVNLSTYNCTNYYATMTFTNQASLYPSESQTFALYDIQSGSKAVYDGEKLVAVMNGSNVAVASASVTNSEKIITEQSDPTNRASSYDENNSIVITGRSSVFTYTLNVWNQGGGEDSGAIANPAMKKLVILDNLPRPGDTNTQNTTERGSQFLVGLMSGEGTITITDTNGTPRTLDSRYYTVQYTDKTEFTDADHNGTETVGWYTQEQWREEKKMRWHDVRAFRIIIQDPNNPDEGIIPSGAKVSVTFDVLASQESSEDIPRGSYAWNNFGYSYVFVGSNVQNKAMSSEVGVRLAARPALVKKLTDQTGKEYIATEDMSFDFLVYQVAYDEEGNEITPVLTPEEIAALITGKSKEEAKTALRTYLMEENNVPHVMFYDGLTVPAGSSQSEIVALTPPAATEGGKDYYWRWTDGTDYRIIELPYSGDAYDNFAFANWQEYSGGHGTDPSYLFNYDVTKIVMLTCTNQYKYWDLQVFKEDDATRDAEAHNMLSGAVFGLYTNQKPANFDSTAENSTIQIERDGIYDTWYLLKTEKTEEDGLAAFNGLSEYEYYIVELRSPSGYQRIKEPIQIHRDNNSLTRTYTVYNYTTVELPETGGIGTFPYMFSGLACMTLACVLIYITKRKQRKEAK